MTGLSYDVVLIQSAIKNCSVLFVSSNEFEFTELKKEHVLNITSALIVF